MYMVTNLRIKCSNYNMLLYFLVQSVMEPIRKKYIQSSLVVASQFGAFNLNEPIDVRPKTDSCPACNSPVSVSSIKNGYILSDVVMNARIHILQCNNPECCKKVEFDGVSLGYINYDNKVIIPIEKIVNYMDLFSANGTPFHTWWKNSFSIELTPSQMENPLYKPMKNWKHQSGYLHEAFVVSTELLKFPPETFKCCESPKAVTMDGCVISIKASRLPNFSHPWVSGTKKGQASVRNGRQLSQIIGEESEDIKNAINGEIVSSSVVESWRDRNHSGLKCLSYCMIETEPRSFKLHNRVSMFAKSLTKLISAACSILPPKCREIAEK